jgi:hypothetical protein
MVGMVAGLAGNIYMIRLFGQRRITRTGFLFFSMVSGGLFAIAAFPDIVNVINSIIFPNQQQFTRLLTLLILSSFLLWLLLVWERNKIFKRGLQINALVKAIGVNDFAQRYAHFTGFKSILVAIPAFNEANNLQSLLPLIPKTVLGKDVDIVIVDDGSTDNTVQIAENAGAYIARNCINMGQGLAVQLGFALASWGRAQVIITMDADGQHRPEDMEQLLLPIMKNEADIVIGSRLKGSREKDSPIRHVGVHLFNWIINFLAGTSITDCSSGYRCIRTDVVKSLKLLQEQYNASELIIEASKKKFIIREAPITILKRKHGESKKGKNILYGANFAKAIIKSWWR